MSAISASQLRALQALAAKCFRADTEENRRAARLAWASAQLGRPVSSFCGLHTDEAAQLITELKRTLGQPLTSRRRLRSGRAAGTHGRKNIAVTVPVMAGPDDLARVDRARASIGMTAEGLAAWLASKSSPIGSRRDARIRTLADANRVYWALKAMARRAG